jgi:hypothetical protein
MTRAFYSIVYDIVLLIERKINYFILFYFIYLQLLVLLQKVIGHPFGLLYATTIMSAIYRWENLAQKKTKWRRV